MVPEYSLSLPPPPPSLSLSSLSHFLSPLSSAVAIAVFAYDALGDQEGCLNFDEGDIIEVHTCTHFLFFIFFIQTFNKLYFVDQIPLQIAVFVEIIL